MKVKRIIIILSVVALLLLVPFMAMQYSNDVNWTLFDFLFAALLLFGSGLVIDAVLRKIKNKRYSVALTTFVLVMLFLIWAELGVGIFGTVIIGN